MLVYMQKKFNVMQWKRFISKNFNWNMAALFSFLKKVS